MTVYYEFLLWYADAIWKAVAPRLLALPKVAVRVSLPYTPVYLYAPTDELGLLRIWVREVTVLDSEPERAPIS